MGLAETPDWPQWCSMAPKDTPVRRISPGHRGSRVLRDSGRDQVKSCGLSAGPYSGKEEEGPTLALGLAGGLLHAAHLDTGLGAGCRGRQQARPRQELLVEDRTPPPAS